MDFQLSSPSNDFQSGEGGYMVYQAQSYGTNDWGMSKDINSFNSYLEYEDHKAEEELLLSKTQQEKQIQLFSEFKGLDDLSFDTFSSTLQSCQEGEKLESIQYESLDHTESSNESTFAFPLASLEILKSRFIQLHGEKENPSRYESLFLYGA